MNRVEERAETEGVELEDDDDGQDGVDSAARIIGLLIQNLYSSLHPNSVTINLGLPGFIAYSSHKQSPLLPRCPTKVI
ncbi:hypothetical protein LOK49_LG15G02416 [Camellia lanceoleosa]|uniref:Uncharacterized protein n=1 Tax=Camellia lanceoleosa TaxID=1840588 RepID=A0ACC0F5U9_9ERIC|nr:hypothetical protein LOK49_LG15G02416 [Camellia lanceoleosa]